jgi:hypothetical protein
MRADFTEARRYAPAILFLAEIDSIGSREMIGGDHNLVCQTDVINALLEQIHGIDTVEPVIVIAATTYLERVDPALRRAGRLDTSGASTYCQPSGDRLRMCARRDLSQLPRVPCRRVRFLSCAEEPQPDGKCPTRQDLQHPGP